MVNTEERRISESETVSEEQGGGGVVTGGANAAPSTGTTGGKGKKRGKRSRQGHKAEKSGEEAHQGKTEVGVKRGRLQWSADLHRPTYTRMLSDVKRAAPRHFYLRVWSHGRWRTTPLTPAGVADQFAVFSERLTSRPY